MMSSIVRYGSSAVRGVFGLTARPAARPLAWIFSSVGAICFAATSTWNVTESQPASRNSSMNFSGSLIIRWASSGSFVRFRIPAIIFGPNVRFGTKWPSITSMWNAVGALLLGPRTAYSHVRVVGVEDADGDAGAAGGHRYSPTLPARARGIAHRGGRGRSRRSAGRAGGRRRPAAGSPARSAAS
jgi:hypothetical protein